jgi:hypothetical protein
MAGRLPQGRSEVVWQGVDADDVWGYGWRSDLDLEQERDFVTPFAGRQVVHPGPSVLIDLSGGKGKRVGLRILLHRQLCAVLADRDDFGVPEQVVRVAEGQLG